MRSPSAARLVSPGQFVDVGTYRLHLRCEGVGSPPVVFDAALGASSLSWSLVQPGVAATTLACSYDRAGFAWSDGGPLPRDAGQIANELYDLLSRAAVPMPCVLVGHSFGGLVMRLLAARHPEAAAALVLLEPAHPEEWLDLSDDKRNLVERGVRLCRYGEVAARLRLARAVSVLVGVGALGAARALVHIVSRGRLRTEDEGILAPIWKLPADVRGLLRHMWTQPKFFVALGSQIQSICESAAQVAREAPAHTDIPVIVMTASNAGEARRKADAALAQRSACGRHVLVADSGHWIPLDAPAVVIETINEVVRELRGGGPS